MHFFKRKQESVREPIVRIETSPERGLTSAEVQLRIDAGWDNRPVESPTGSVWQIIAGNVFTYFNLIFFIIAAALLIVGSYNNLSFLVIIFANLMIGIVQELNSKRTLDSLTLLHERRLTAVRNGETVSVSTEDLVIDDIVVFRPGNQICADGIVVSGEVQVNEALITGESDEITKVVGDSLLSGSYVVSGECSARLSAVGADSFVSKMTLDAKRSGRRRPKGMMLSLRRLIQIIGVLIIPLGAGMILRHYFTIGMSIRDNVTQTSAAIIGMIPEGLYLLVNVTLAVSVVKLARRDTLVHDLGCIEMLARVDTLCVDKTGTITENTMSVDSIVPLTDACDVTAILHDFTMNMSPDNATMAALKDRFDNGGEYRTASETVSFSSETKMSAVAFSRDERYILGAPEFVMRERYGEIRETVEPYIMSGYRVLVLASSSDLRQDAEYIVRPLAIVLLSNPIRPEAADTFSYFERQGVDIKVISGDNSYTAASVAAAAGIKGAEDAVDLTGMSDDEVAEAATRYKVFGRVTPEQKRILVRSLKNSGHTVAMTGDGVNDILALKEADCSIAMASGSDVACQISNLVLLKSQFLSLPSVVAEGRQVINNIERSASLFLVKNIFSFLLAIISIFAEFAYPLKPVQVSIVSGLTIGIPSFFLALERNEERVHGRFLLNVIYAALPAALTDLLVVIGVIMFSSAFNIDQTVSSSIITFLMGIVGFTMIFRLCCPFNRGRIVLITSLAVLFVGALALMPSFFEVVCPDFGGWLVFAVFAMLIPSLIFCMDHILSAISESCSRIDKKFRKSH